MSSPAPGVGGSPRVESVSPTVVLNVSPSVPAVAAVADPPVCLGPSHFNQAINGVLLAGEQGESLSVESSVVQLSGADISQIPEATSGTSAPMPVGYSGGWSSLLK